MKQAIVIYFNLLFFTLTFSLSLQAQQTDPEKEKINSTLNNYFALDRENIHLHLDKNVFITNEKIWFKGYVFDRKNNFPFINTSNVFAILADERGITLKQELLFADNGTFSGIFNLDNTYKSGTYYIRLYTNWMNNFSEDESAVFKISIINENDTSLRPSDSIDYSKINIDFYPEGGNLIAGISNNIGLQILDCNKHAIPIKDVNLINAKGDILKNILINRFGNGRFNLVPTSETYKIVFTLNGIHYENTLPNVFQKGIALEINNYSLPEKTLVKIRTNQQSLASYSDKPLYLVIQQDNKISIIDVNFNNKKLEQELLFSNDYINKGTNTVRLLDSDFKQIAQRLIFKYPETVSNLTLENQGKTNDAIHFSGKINYSDAKISVSVVPANSIATNNYATIYGSFLLDPYLTEKAENTSYYFDQPSRAKHYELDLLLLNQKTYKYEWDNIVSNPPKETFEFDYGLTLKGTVNQSLTDRRKYKIQVYSVLSGINERSEINDKNEFYFKNLVLPDSSQVNFALLKMPELKITELKVYPQVLNAKRNFNKIFNPQQSSCEIKTEVKTEPEYEIPHLKKKIVELEEVKVLAKTKLKNAGKFGNSNLRGFKIDENESNVDLLTFIERNGFQVSNEHGEVSITVKGRHSFKGSTPVPAIYVNDRQLMTQEQLNGIRMSDIDEIFINSHAIVPSVNNNMGIIKIYLKKLTYNTLSKNSGKPFIIQGGFEVIPYFKNADYLSTTDKAFESFGLIQWVPLLLTDSTGSFEFQIPDTGIKSVKVLIEGFSADGGLISETRIINLE